MKYFRKLMNSLKKAKKNQKTKKQFTEIIESVQDLKIETEIILKNGNWRNSGNDSTVASITKII